MTCAITRTRSFALGLVLWGGCVAEHDGTLSESSAALEAAGECLIGDESLEHACLHANYGPFAAVTAQTYPGLVFAEVNAPHTAFTVELPAAASGFAGAVLYQPTVTGEFGFLLDRPMDAALYDSAGALVVPVGTAAGSPDACPQINHVLVYALSDAETYTLALSSATESAPLLITEYLGVEASCELACEPITLIASRTYHPATWTDAEMTLEHDVMIELPERLSVTEGTAGFGLALLTISSEDHEVVCRYRGNGRRRYVFRSCSNGAVPGDDVEASFVALHVERGGNIGPGERTTVELTLQPECDHEHDHEGE